MVMIDGNDDDNEFERKPKRKKRKNKQIVRQAGKQQHQNKTK